MLLRRNQLWHNNMPSRCLNVFCPDLIPIIQGEFIGQKSTTSQLIPVLCAIEKYICKSTTVTCRNEVLVSLQNLSRLKKQIHKIFAYKNPRTWLLTVGSFKWEQFKILIKWGRGKRGRGVEEGGIKRQKVIYFPFFTLFFFFFFLSICCWLWKRRMLKKRCGTTKPPHRLLEKEDVHKEQSVWPLMYRLIQGKDMIYVTVST